MAAWSLAVANLTLTLSIVTRRLRQFIAYEVGSSPEVLTATAFPAGVDKPRTWKLSWCAHPPQALDAGRPFSTAPLAGQGPHRPVAIVPGDLLRRSLTGWAWSPSNGPSAFG
jgi:hypothetical protein